MHAAPSHSVVTRLYRQHYCGCARQRAALCGVRVLCFLGPQIPLLHSCARCHCVEDGKVVQLQCWHADSESITCSIHDPGQDWWQLVTHLLCMLLLCCGPTVTRPGATHYGTKRQFHTVKTFQVAVNCLSTRVDCRKLQVQGADRV
jgi:hypothetical protein